MDLDIKSVDIGLDWSICWKKKSPQRGLSSKPPGHESNTLTTEPPGQGFEYSNTSVSFFLRIDESHFNNADTLCTLLLDKMDFIDPYLLDDLLIVSQ